MSSDEANPRRQPATPAIDRRRFIGVTTTGAVGAGALAGLGAFGPGSLVGDAEAKKRKKKRKKRKLRRIDRSLIGMQVYSMRAMIGHDNYGSEPVGWDAALDALADSGYKEVEVGGSYYGGDAASFRELVDAHGLTVAGSHVPGGANAFRNNMEATLDDAETLGLKYVGLASAPGDVARTHDGFKAMAEEFNGFGEAAAARGMRFYFHNHPNDHVLDGGRSIYHTLLEETDRSLVSFELDIAWAVAGGEPIAALVRDNWRRFPLFHVKDLRWDPEGNRSTPSNVAKPNRPFFLCSVGKGDINFANIFRQLPNLDRHHYLVEDDDAGNLTINPPGVVNFTWFSRRTLAQMEIKPPKKNRKKKKKKK